MMLAGNDNGFTPETIDPILHNAPVPVFGGLFPGILCEHSLLQRGTLVLALPSLPRIQIVRGLPDEGREFDDQLNDDLLGDAGKTMFVLVDGLAMRDVDPNAKIVLASGFTREDFLVEMKNSGLCDFIRKPFSTRMLSRTIYRTLHDCGANGNGK